LSWTKNWSINQSDAQESQFTLHYFYFLLFLLFFFSSFFFSFEHFIQQKLSFICFDEIPPCFWQSLVPLSV
jgi:hypothetical protein